MSSISPRSLYRSLIRELAANPSNPPRALASPAFHAQPIVHHVRSSFRTTSSSDAEPMLREMSNLETYLRSNRMHKVLLLRYNPLHDQTEQERVKATARRVGLEVPKEYQPPGEKGDMDKEEVREFQEFLKGRKGGPLPPPELQSGLGGL